MQVEPDKNETSLFLGAVSRPDKKIVESGDFIWTKHANALVPYKGKMDDGGSREKWQEEKEIVLMELVNSASTCQSANKRAKLLSNLSYDDFLLHYAGALPERNAVVMGGVVNRVLYVGHCGVMEVDSLGQIWVIDAAVDTNVSRTAYDKWLEKRQGQRVWLKRLKGRKLAERASVAFEASKYIGRPYNFWNFDLDDDSMFYCSKLMWLAVYKALGFSVDDDLNPDRAIWFSPKQFIASAVLEPVFDSGVY